MPDEEWFGLSQSIREAVVLAEAAQIEYAKEKAARAKRKKAGTKE